MRKDVTDIHAIFKDAQKILIDTEITLAATRINLCNAEINNGL